MGYLNYVHEGISIWYIGHLNKIHIGYLNEVPIGQDTWDILIRYI